MAQRSDVSSTDDGQIKIAVDQEEKDSLPEGNSHRPEIVLKDDQFSKSGVQDAVVEEDEKWGEFTTISLKKLFERALEDDASEVGQKMRTHLANGEAVPKTLIYTILQEALAQADPRKPILIIDRKLSTIQDEQKERKKSTTSTIDIRTDNVTVDLSHTDKKISTTTATNGEILNGERRMEIDAGQTHSRTRKILQKLKNAFWPLDNSTSRPNLDKDSHFFTRYLKKMQGHEKRSPYERPLEALQSFITSFVGIMALTAIDYFFLADTDYTLVIGSFGATAVLIFCAMKSPLAQPRNVLGGHALAAVIGVIFQISLGKNFPWLAAAFAVSVSIAIMSLTHTVHPPAGATALIAVYSNDMIHRLGFMYILVPVLAGAVILVLVAVVMNNLFPSRRYPVYWL